MKRTHIAVTLLTLLVFVYISVGNSATLMKIQPAAEQVPTKANKSTITKKERITPRAEEAKKTKPDLTITSLKVDQNKVNKGERIEATAKISNTSKVGAKNVTVQFSFAGKPYGRPQILSVPARKTLPVLTMIIADRPGRQTLAVEVDSAGTINETNEKNNIRTLSITVLRDNYSLQKSNPAALSKGISKKSDPTLHKNVAESTATKGSLTGSSVAGRFNSLGYCCTKTGISRLTEKQCKKSEGTYSLSYGGLSAACINLKPTFSKNMRLQAQKPTVGLLSGDVFKAEEMTEEKFNKLPDDAVIQDNGNRMTKLQILAENEKSKKEAIKMAKQKEPKIDFKAARDKFLKEQENKMITESAKRKSSFDSMKKKMTPYNAIQKEAVQLYQKSQTASLGEKEQIEKRAAELLQQLKQMGY